MSTDASQDEPEHDEMNFGSTEDPLETEVSGELFDDGEMDQDGYEHHRASTEQHEVHGSDSRPNRLIGSADDDTLVGGHLDDLIEASQGHDIIDGGDGDDTITLAGRHDEMALAIHANGDVVVTSSGGTQTLRHIEKLHFSDSDLDESIMSLLPAPKINAAHAASYSAKVEAYFLGALGRAATDEELTHFSDVLDGQQGNVWRDEGGATGTTGSLAGYLDNHAESFKLLSANSGEAVDRVYQALTGEAAPQTVNEYYQAQLDNGTIKLKGLVNAMLNDLAIMPRTDGSLAAPNGWAVDHHDEMTPVALIGLVHKLNATGHADFDNLDASGNLI